MLINKDPLSHEFSKQLESKLDEIRALSSKYLDKKLKLNFSPNNDYLPLEHVAWLIAISVLYKHHDEIDWTKNKKLYDMACDIHCDLIDEIFKKVFHPIKNSICGEFKLAVSLTRSENNAVRKALYERGLYGVHTRLDDTHIAYDPMLHSVGMTDFEYIRNDLTISLLTQRGIMQKCLPNKTRKQQNNSHENKPSAYGSSKSETIRIALEKIAVSLSGAPVNRDTLWTGLRKDAKENPNSFFKLDGKNVTEKATNTSWTREKANHHLNAIISWYNNR